MKCLVTGSDGFIGRHLVKALEHQGDGVTPFDLDVGCDVSNQQQVKEAAKECDIIFHLAAVSTSPECDYDPERAIRVNIGGMVNVLMAASEAGVETVVYASSSRVYGVAENMLLQESNRVKPLNLYSATKLAAENIASLYPIRTVGLRYASVYGPGSEAKGSPNVISRYILGMLRNQPPVVFGDGLQIRDFVHVSDVVAANILAANNDVGHEVFNIGTGIKTNMLQLIQLLNKVLETRFRPRYVKRPGAYMLEQNLDMFHAKSVLGFTAQVSLEAGVSELVEYYRRGGT